MSIKRRLERLEVSTDPASPPAEPSETAEALYLMELEWHRAGSSELIHDDSAEAFYSPGGEFAVSRRAVDLGVLMRF